MHRKSLVVSCTGGLFAVLTPSAAPWGADYSLFLFIRIKGKGRLVKGENRSEEVKKKDRPGKGGPIL